MGADVFNGEGTNIGMVGQRAVIIRTFIRRVLYWRWGTGQNQRCRRLPTRRFTPKNRFSI